MSELTIEKASGIGMPDYKPCFKIDIPKQLESFGQITGSCAWVSTDKLVRVRFESAEQALLTDLETHEHSEEVIEVRNIPMSQIKDEMLSLQADGKTRYADEIAEILELDVIDVIEAFSQLQEEDKLFVDNDKL